MFTKQHYEAIAQVIDTQTLLPDDQEEGYAVHKAGLVEALADLFEQDNERFNRDKFFKACYDK